MYGAMFGDIVGSIYEFHNIKTKDFSLFSPGCRFTDDTVMTVAVAKAILTYLDDQPDKAPAGPEFSAVLVGSMQELGRKYPAAGYGGKFARWLTNPTPASYHSFGNGSAMRVSPCGLIASSLEEALLWAKASAQVTHDHPEGIKGAQAVAAAVFLAKTGHKKSEIRRYLTEHFYPLAFTLADIRASYRFDVSCQGSVPQGLEAFLESHSCEDAVRNAISIGGDCDTIGAMAGSIAWWFYPVQAASDAWAKGQLLPEQETLKAELQRYLPPEFIEIADRFEVLCHARLG